MTTLELLITNLKGVFADLDDGGLTEDEALYQIRDIVERADEKPDWPVDHELGKE